VLGRRVLDLGEVRRPCAVSVAFPLGPVDRMPAQQIFELVKIREPVSHESRLEGPVDEDIETHAQAGARSAAAAIERHQLEADRAWLARLDEQAARRIHGNNATLGAGLGIAMREVEGVATAWLRVDFGLREPSGHQVFIDESVPNDSAWQFVVPLQLKRACIHERTVRRCHRHRAERRSPIG